ncbi:MAG: helix-turn-helix transcriptional regulator [Gemmatimonadetes bacterium]|nr:helix-turn-helix transcriptional regulator [Gemmatimonadota bacterium]
MHPHTPSATTDEILREAGERLKRYRLQQNRTVAEVASEAGVAIRTVERAESGANPTFETVVRILRALGRVDALDAFLPAPLVSPLQLASMAGRERQRAGRPRRRSSGPTSD